MGQEANCKVRLGGKTVEGKALLETDELIFRAPDLRLKIQFRDVKSIVADDGWLRVTFREGAAEFELGRAAAKWAEKIRNPKSLIDKLGVKAESRVAVLGIKDADFQRDLRARTQDVLESKAGKNCDLILWGAERDLQLGELTKLQKSLKPDGAIWVVYPKGQKEITEAGVLAAGERAGLVDVKVARFSSTHTALKFVIPAARR
jgi:hypothetical protein